MFPPVELPLRVPSSKKELREKVSLALSTEIAFHG